MRQPAHPVPSPFVLRPVCLAVCLLGLPAAHALPQGGTPTFGQTDVRQTAPGQLLIHQGTVRAGIDWTSFSIAAGERVQIVQPGRDSVLVNRVVGNDPSSIFGQLQSNGNVWLVNPRGIFFGASSRIDVGGLVATTLNLEGGGAEGGRIRLGRGSEGAGEIRSEGQITARGGTVVLAAPQVTHSGSIEAQRVGIAAATQVEVDVEGDGLVLFNVRNDGSLPARLSLLGNVTADGGTADLRAAARAGFADTVLNLEGVVRARSIGQRNGRVFIDGGSDGAVIVSGAVDASGSKAGERGGDVTITGDKVGLASGSTVDASGDGGGGRIRVGGGFHGADGDMRNASMTVVQGGATLKADAGERGDGGQVVVWSDRSTVFAGDIQARGGAQGGDGGQAEVSGKQHLAFEGRADLGAANGRRGSLLLDPDNIEIVASGPDMRNDGNGDDLTDLTPAGGTVTIAFGDFAPGGPTPTSTITAGAVTSQLVGSNVLLQANNNIKVDAAIADPGSSNTLTLQVGGAGTINVNQAINLAAGTVELIGNTSMAAAGQFNVGTLKVSGGTLTLDSAASVAATATVNIVGSATLELPNTAVTIGSLLGDGTLRLGNTAAANLTLGTAADTTFAGAITGGNPNVVLTKAGAGRLTLTGASTFNGSTVVSAGTLELGGGGSLPSGSDLKLDGGTLALSASGTFTLDHRLELGTGGGTVETAPLAVATLSQAVGGAGGFTKTGDGTLTFGDSVTYGGNTRVSGGLLVLSSSTSLSGATSVTVDGGATLRLAGNVTVGSLSLAGTLDRTSATDKLTATAYTLATGANALANLGTGSLTATGNATLAGTSEAGTVAVNNGATLTLGSANRLADTAAVTVNGTLKLNGDDTVGSLTLAGTLDRTGATDKLTATTYALTGSSTQVVANLGAGTVNSSGSGVTLSGTADAANVNVTAGLLTLGAAERLADGAALAVSGGTLKLNGNETVATLSLAGTLDKTGATDKLTASTTTLATGANVLAHLGAGSLTATGNATLAGTSDATTVIVDNGATLTLGSANRLADTAAVTVNGTLKLNGDDTVGSLALAGTLDRTGAADKLTAATYALTGAATQVIANLGTGTVNSSGSGVTLSGTVDATVVNVTAGRLTLDGANRLGSGTAVAVDGTLALTGSQSVGALSGSGSIDVANSTLTTTISGSSSFNGDFTGGTSGGLTKAGGGTLTLAGSLGYGGVTRVSAGALVLASGGRLAAASQVDVDSLATLRLGGNESVAAADIAGTLDRTNASDQLSANVTTLSTGANVLARLGTGTLRVTGNATLAGTSDATAVIVDSGATLTLGAADRLADTASVSVNGTLTLNGNDTVGSFTLAGTLNKTGAADKLTAANYALTGAATQVNANLGTGTLDSSGSGVTLNGTSDAATVNVSTGQLNLGSAERLADTAALTVDGTLRLNGNETVRVATLGGTLQKTQPTDTLFAGTYTLGNGANVVANLGPGSLLVNGNATLAGSSGAATVDVNGGARLTLVGPERLADGAFVTVALNGTLALGGAEKVGTLNANGTVTGGSLSADDYVLSGGTYDTNLLGGRITSTGTTLINGLANATIVNVNGGTLTLGSAERLTDRPDVTIAGGATLVLQGSETFGSLAGAGTLQLGSSTLTTGWTRSTRFEGVVNGSGGQVVKEEAGTTFTLAGSGSFGKLQVAQGTLAVEGANALAGIGSVQVDGTGTLSVAVDAAAGTVSIAGTLAGAGTLIANAATLTGGSITGHLGGTALASSGNSNVSGRVSSGTLTVSDGTLTLGAAGRLAGSTQVLVEPTARLNLGGDENAASLLLRGTLGGSGTFTASDYTLDGGVANANLGGGHLVSVGSSTLVGSAAAGRVEVNGGMLTLTGADRLAPGAQVTVLHDATLALGGDNVVDTLALVGTLGGVGTLRANAATLDGGTVAADLGATTLQSAGTSRIDGRVTAGTLTVSGGTLTLGAAERLADTTNVVVAATAALSTDTQETVARIDAAGRLAGSGRFSATTVTLAGGSADAALAGGTLRSTGGSHLNGTSAMATVVVEDGTLTLGSAGRLAPASRLDVATDATLMLGGAESVASANLAGTLAGPATLTATDMALAGGTVQAGTGVAGSTLHGNGRIDGGARFAAIAVDGGTLTLGSANRLADAPAVSVASGATLALGGDETLGTLSGSGGVLLGAATIGVGNASDSVFGGRLEGSGALVKQGTGSLTLAGATSHTGGTQVNAGTLVLAGDDILADGGAVSVARDATLAVNGRDTVARLDLNGTLAGSGTLSADRYALDGANVTGNLGAGALMTSVGNSRIAGSVAPATLQVNGGTLTLAAPDRVADGATVSVASGATLALNGNDTVARLQVAGTLAGSGRLTAADIALEGGRVTADLAGERLVSRGDSQLEGHAAVPSINVESGTLVLGSAGRLEGAPALALGGALVLGGDETLGTLAGGGTLALGSATLTTGSGGSSDFSGSLGGSGGLTKQGSGDFVLSGSSTYTGSTRVEGGALVLADGASLATSGFVVDGTLRYTPAAGHVQDLAVPVSGSGALELAGSGELRLSGSNKTYTGATRVLAGTLSTAGAEALPDTSAVTVAAGATLVLGSAETVASIDTDSAAHLVLGGNFTTSGAMNLQGDVVYHGAAPITLSGTRIDATHDGNDWGARLSIDASGPLALSSGRSGGVLRDLTLGELEIGAGGRVDAGVISLDGLAHVAGGTLTLASGAAPVGQAADSSFAGRNAPGGRPIGFASDVVTQTAGRIDVAAGAQLSVVSEQGGSVRLLADDNHFAGALEVRSGAAVSPWSPNLRSVGGAETAVQGRVQVAGDTVTIGGAGIEADVVTIRADRLSTEPGAVIVARLPFDNRVGTADSVPGLTLELTPVAFGLPFPFGQRGAEIAVSVGSRDWGARTLPIDGGYLRVLPRHGASGATAVVLTGPQVGGTYSFFFDGAGQSGEIPVFYNGLLPLTPEISGSLSATLAVSEGARRDRFDESVRTENVAVRLRAGVIAEVGPGRPATVGSEGIRAPAGCAPAGATLACEAN